MYYIFLLLGTVFALTPVVYTFLQLSGHIGPDDEADAGTLGVLLWVVGLALALSFFLAAQAMIPMMALAPK